MALARMKVEKGTNIEVYKNCQESGFSGFGIQMQTKGELESMVSFVNQARQSLMTYS